MHEQAVEEKVAEVPERQPGPAEEHVTELPESRQQPEEQQVTEQTTTSGLFFKYSVSIVPIIDYLLLV